MRKLWALLLLCGCKAGPAVPPSPVDPMMKIVIAMRDAYVRKNETAFMAHVAPRYQFDLRDAVSRDFRESTILGIDLWHDRTVGSFVTVRWEKRVEDRRTGRRVVGTGRTELVFENRQLIDQRGDRLFGWTASEVDLTVDSVAVALPSITAQIGNAGSVDAQNVRVRLLIDGAAVGGDKFTAVPARGRAVVAWSGAFPPAPGHTARVTVDPLNAIVETDEFNNERDAAY